MSNLSWVLRSVTVRDSLLHGLVAWPEKPIGLVVHVHGTWGNFYGNAFVEEVAVAAVSEGWAFATVNVPGHDETAMDEVLEDSTTAISQWLEALNPSALPVVIQGHSLGALKTIKLASDPIRMAALHVKALVLLSAFDCIGFYARESNLSGIELAAMPAGEIVPESVFGYWLLRWDMLSRLMAVDGEWDLFRSRLLDPDRLLGSVEFSVPVFYAIGDQDFAAVPSVEAVVEIVRQAGFATDVAVIPEAPHGFGGQKQVLAAGIVRWLRSVATTSDA